jgi:hypothetical protein
MSLRIPAIFLAIAVAAVACRGKVSDSDIERWKKSDSRGQIADALAGRDTPPAVRVHAARALIELAADAHFQGALRKLDKATRALVARELGPELDRLLASPDLARQVLAKDFLGLLIITGDAHTAERAGAAVVGWLAADFRGRTSLGKVSAVEVMKRIGTPALPALHALLRPESDLLLIANVIRGIGDKDGIRHASDLVARAALAQGPRIPQRSLRALFVLGDSRAAEQLARVTADEKLPLTTRRFAAEEMRALGHRASLDVAARVALSPSEDLYVRESCLVYLEKVCDGSCAPYLGDLWKILKERGLRFEAASAILKVGGASALPQLLRRLPADEYGQKGLNSLVEDIAKNAGPAALPALRAGLGQRHWPGKLLSIRALAVLGDKGDANRLDKLRGDRSTPKGWTVGTRIGEEAARAAQQIRTRTR